MAQKSVKIDSELFLDLIEYFLKKEQHTDEELRQMQDRICLALQIKKDSITARIMYKQYIEAEGDERERLRQRYLNFIGVPSEFRSASESEYPQIPEA